MENTISVLHGYPYGAENRNGWTLNTIADRAKNPNFETKSDYNV